MESSVTWNAPWSTDLIRNHNPWTLAGDAGMFLYLQQSGTDFASKALEAQAAVENICTRSTLLNKKLDNAFNDFQMLSNTQFLENRIEEEPTEGNLPNKTPENTNDKPLTKEEKEEQLKVAFKECLKKSFEIFANARLGTESESDLLFIERPSLPYTIGSQEYNNSQTAGIVFPFPVVPVETHLSNGTHENDPGERQVPGEISDEDDDLFPDAAAASQSNAATEMADGESARGMESSGMAPGENHQENGSFDASSSHEQERASTVSSSKSPNPRRDSDRNEQRTIVLSPPNLNESDSEDDEDDLFVVKPKRTLTVSNKGNETASNTQNSDTYSSNQQASSNAGSSRDRPASSVLEQPPPLQDNANVDTDSSSSEDDLFKSVRKVTVAKTESAPSKSVNAPQQSGAISVGPGRVKFSEDDESDTAEVPLHPKPTSNLMAMFDESSDDETFLISTRSSAKPSLFASEDNPGKKPTVSASTLSIVEKTDQVESSSSEVTGSAVDKQESEDEDLGSKLDEVAPSIPVSSKVAKDIDSDDGFPNMTGKPNNLARIFGSTDDDDFESIMSAEQKSEEKKKVVSATSEQPPAPKQEKVSEKPLAAQQLSGFLDDDEDNDDDDLFKSLGQQKSSVKKPETNEKPKPQLKRIDDSDDDELFKSVTLPSVKATSSNKLVSNEVKKEAVNEAPKITTDSDSDELFTSSSDKKKSTEYTKPTFSASITKDVNENKEFIDPLGSLTKSSGENIPASTSPGQRGQKFVDVSNTVELPPLDVEIETAALSSPEKLKSPVSGSIAERAKSIKIAPGMFVPGMAPPSIRKIQSQTSVPAATATGATVAEIGKDKAKLGPKRRPPSRPSRTSSVGGSFSVSKDPFVPELPKVAEVVHVPEPLPIQIPETSSVKISAPSPVVPTSSANDFDIFEESLSAPVTFHKKTSDSSSLGAEARKEIVGGAAPTSPEVDIFAENALESPEKTKIATKTTGATKKKKAGNVKSAKSKSKRSDGAVKEDTSKKPDLFDTPDDIFDD